MNGDRNEQMAGTEHRGRRGVVGVVGVRRGRLVDRARRGTRGGGVRRGTVVRTLAVSLAVLVAAAGCANPHYTQDPGPGRPPTVVGIEFSGNQNQYDSDCAIGLTEDGLTWIAGAGTPFGVGEIPAQWLAYTITGSLTPVGAPLGDCWNALTNNDSQFALLMQCAGEPVIKYWFDNMGNAEAWAAIPFCKCNLTCQAMSNDANIAAWYAADRAARFYRYCSTPPIDWADTTCLAQPPNGWPLGKHGVSGAIDADGPLYGPAGSPLPASWADPWWDATKPVPPEWSDPPPAVN